ncbi:MAG: methyltransferase domain-containing protein [Terracidiphilus sp.]|jgi:SAM-dependent methyltransferase
MPSNSPDFRTRAQLTEIMDEPCGSEVLRSYLRGLATTNRLTLAYRPLLHWLHSLASDQKTLPKPLHILDVGCGYGDSLRRIERWANERDLAVELTGLDLNPDATAIAADASPASSEIQWVNANVLTFTPRQPVHLAISSLFTHHLADSEIVRFIRWMEAHAEIGWFINDLSRAALPYHFFRAFSKLVGLHPFVRHDGPISIARSFVPHEWRDLCSAAGLGPHEAVVQSFRPARLCVARRKSGSESESG